MKIVSFDVSSSTIGWAYLTIDNKKQIKLMQHGYIKPPKTGHLLENLRDTQAEISAILKDIKPNQIAIEDIVQFMPRASSANTVITLATFNRMVGLTALSYLKALPALYSVMTIRHALKQTKELPKKEQIPALVETLLGITLEIPLKKSGKIQVEFYDQADAIAVGLYHCYKLTNRLEDIKKQRKLK